MFWFQYKIEETATTIIIYPEYQLHNSVLILKFCNSGGSKPGITYKFEKGLIEKTHANVLVFPHRLQLFQKSFSVSVLYVNSNWDKFWYNLFLESERLSLNVIYCQNKNPLNTLVFLDLIALKRCPEIFQRFFDKMRT